ncbi:MAG: DPP IV N-terminal domain-containing protein [Acidobacteriota bacterium]
MRFRLLLITLLSLTPLFASMQDRPQILIRPPAQEEIILAVPDVQPRTPAASPELAEALQTFNQVLWDDLWFSGYFTMAGRSFYPPQPIVGPEDINHDAWSVLPFRISFLSAGTLELSGGVLRAELRVYDMKQKSMSFGQRISGERDQVRSIAHRWADEIVYKLTAGASRGIAGTKIAYSTRQGNAKEIYVMDYDGYDPRPFTRTGSINLFPSWSPDNSKLAFTSVRTGKWEINIYSFVDGARAPFPLFNSFASTPAIAPDGEHLVFGLRNPRGDSDLHVSKLDGSERRNITNHPAIDGSPTWSPSGMQIAFTSDRQGTSQIYICDSDGANVRRIVTEGGDADAPTWSPDGRWIAFHWRPRFGDNYNIYLAEASTGKLFQVTSGSGSNESPTWAPDSRHLAFQSNRTGGFQIYIGAVDRPEVRMVTRDGANTGPAWSGYIRRD